VDLTLKLVILGAEDTKASELRLVFAIRLMIYSKQLAGSDLWKIVVFKGCDTVDIDDAKSTYRRLHEFLSPEQGQKAALTKKCSLDAPDERSCEV
jgi:hypothetical protein